MEEGRDGGLYDEDVGEFCCKSENALTVVVPFMPVIDREWH